MHIPIGSIIIIFIVFSVSAVFTEPLKWEKDKSWGWVLGAVDAVGALNAIPIDSVDEAVKLVGMGKVRDLGVYGRTLYIWSGNLPGDIISFSSPEKVKCQKTSVFITPERNNTSLTTRYRSALFFSNNDKKHKDIHDDLKR